MPLPIPMEMEEQAIDFLHDDVPALAACALASRVLLAIACFHIWRDLAVPVQAHPTHSRMQELVEILHCQVLDPEGRPLLSTREPHTDSSSIGMTQPGLYVSGRGFPTSGSSSSSS